MISEETGSMFGKFIRRGALAAAVLAGVTFGFASTADAQWGGHGHYGHGHGYHGGGHGYGWRGSYGGHWGVPYQYGFHGPRWHDTSHWDYHSGYSWRHGNHYHYEPGHYDFHRDGHWDW
jgi:hypothetical protein